jgi:hypothetical protein
VGTNLISWERIFISWERIFISWERILFLGNEQLHHIRFLYLNLLMLWLIMRIKNGSYLILMENRCKIYGGWFRTGGWDCFLKIRAQNWTSSPEFPEHYTFHNRYFKSWNRAVLCGNFIFFLTTQLLNLI